MESRTTALADVVAGARIDGYEVLAHLAAGGMGSVYVVRKRSGSFDRRFALKLMHPHFREDRVVHDMFLDEAMIASRIRHPNVASVLDMGSYRGAPYLVMELVSGRSLNHVAASHAQSSMPVGMLLALLANIAEGLHAAHETCDNDGAPLHIAHRDVSPQNVLVGFDGAVRVVDFGIAKARGRLVVSETGEVKGKLAYMAPEQFRSEPVLDRRVDVWSFGVVAWELLAKRRLFPAADLASKTLQVLEAPIEPLFELDSSLPKEACDAIARCLVRDRELRAPELGSIASILMSVAEREGRHRPRDLAEEMEARFGQERRRDESEPDEREADERLHLLDDLTPSRSRPRASAGEASDPLESTKRPPPRRHGARPLFVAGALGAMALLASSLPRLMSTQGMSARERATPESHAEQSLREQPTNQVVSTPELLITMPSTPEVAAPSTQEDTDVPVLAREARQSARRGRRPARRTQASATENPPEDRPPTEDTVEPLSAESTAHTASSTRLLPSPYAATSEGASR